FQAEDGIRYLIVTGVQTCALPIFLPKCQALAGPGGDCRHIRHPQGLRRYRARRCRTVTELAGPIVSPRPQGPVALERRAVVVPQDRKSVVLGKEYRARWAQSNTKK